MCCIGINIDHLMKELLWFEDALANGYKDNCDTQRLLFYNLMMRWKLIMTDTHTILDEKEWEETLREREQKMNKWCFGVTIETLLFDWWNIMWQMRVIR